MTLRELFSSFSPLTFAILIISLLELNQARVVPSRYNSFAQRGNNNSDMSALSQSWSSVISQTANRQVSSLSVRSRSSVSSSLSSSSTVAPVTLTPVSSPNRVSAAALAESHRAWCRQFDDSEACIANGCCLANYTVSMKTMRGNRQLRVSECVSKVQENHFCIKPESPIRQALEMLVSTSTGRSSASKVFAYLQCPCAAGLECMTDRLESSISICRKSNVPDFLTTLDENIGEEVDLEDTAKH